MAKLTTNHLLLWFGTEAARAAISPSFPRYNIGTTARFLIGAAASAEGGSTGGSTTHTHANAQSHAHTMSTHTHTFGNSSGDFQLGAVGDPPTTGGAEAPPTQAADDATGHHHGNAASPTESGYTFTDSATITPGSSTGGETTPPYVEALLIGPAADGADVPTGATVLYQSGTAPSGFAVHDGTGTTPDLTNKFPRIAADAAVDGGATGGTTSTHQHPQSHSHTVPNHTHAEIQCADATNTVSNKTGTTEPNTGMTPDHHNMSLDSAATPATEATTGTISDNQIEDFSSPPIEPPWLKLAAIKCTGAASTPDGIITAYKGTLAQLAALSDWKLCDGTGGTPDMRGVQSKIAFTSIGTTGGGAHHRHFMAKHQHPCISTHTHTTTESSQNKHLLKTNASGRALKSTVGTPHLATDHTWSVSSDAPSGQTQFNATLLYTDYTTPLDPWLTVLWVKYVKPKGYTFAAVSG